VMMRNNKNLASVFLDLPPQLKLRYTGYFSAYLTKKIARR